MMPGVTLPNSSSTCAVTQCSSSTTLVAVGGVSSSVAGSPGVTVTLTVWTALVGPPGVVTAVSVHEYTPTVVGAVIVSTNGITCGPVSMPVGKVGLKLKPIGQPAETTRSAVYGTSFALAMMNGPIVPAPLSSTAVPPVAVAMSS